MVMLTMHAGPGICFLSTGSSAEILHTCFYILMVHVLTMYIHLLGWKGVQTS